MTYYFVEAGKRRVYESWLLKATSKDGCKTPGFQCPRCYRVLEELRGGHNCRISDWQPYQCSRCWKTCYPHSSILAKQGEKYFKCLWCGENCTIDNRFAHARICLKSPKEGICWCGQRGDRQTTLWQQQQQQQQQQS